jgi:hypothetical protein
MTSEAIRARNRSNARKSTGPKTARGKTAVAGNARKHGMTARPDPASVATWLAIITGHPDISLLDLMPQDDLAYRALGLAQAEARLVIAERSMRTYKAGYADRDDAMWDLDRAARFMRELRAQRTGTSQEMQTVATTGSLGSQSAIYAGHDWLMDRYLAEARAQRRKAFRAWIAAGGAAQSRA